VPREASAQFIDSIISAELPDVVSDPLAYLLVDEFMVHGPCGGLNGKCPCMKEGVCSKRFPKSFSEDTSVDQSGFPVYRRRVDGRTVKKDGHYLDNKWVVPHNVALLKRYQAHINVEWRNKTNLVKYLFKYITKGPDCANVVLRPLGFSHEGRDGEEGVDEVAEYISCRYLSACEAFWRLYGFEIHVRAPAVECLEIHLPGMNRVTYSEDADLGDIVENDNYRRSTLTEWFAMNRRHPECRDLTYCEFPTKYTWYSDGRRWVKRGRGFLLGRIRHVSPSTGELFYMRMLLMAVRGAQSFEDLRRHAGVTHLTYREACQARGLLGDDSEWARVFDETVVWATAAQLRNLFVTILMYCDVGDAGKLFENYWRYLVDDFVHIRRQALRNQNYSMPDSLQRTYLLKELGRLFANNGGSLSSYNLPDAVLAAGQADGNRLIFEETCYNRQVLDEEWQLLHSRLNPDQAAVYNNVMQIVDRTKQEVLFVSGHGGTGKTFLWRTVIAKLRSQGMIVLAVASSGVAALLLPGGRTAHSRFKIPLDMGDRALCNIHRGTDLADLIKQTSLVLWDEAPMSHRGCVESLDRSLRDLLSEDHAGNAALPFGGLPVVMGGDFQQVLPVIPGASRAQIVDAALSSSPLWCHVKVVWLSENMRLTAHGLTDGEKREFSAFSNWVLAIGDGTLQARRREGDSEATWVSIPERLLIRTDGDRVDSLIDSIYDDFASYHASLEYLAARAIVCPTNAVVDAINDRIAGRVQAETWEYLSADRIAPGSEQIPNVDVLYTEDILNTITQPNYPNHRLVLKVGMPVILLRNLNQAMGLCNGTRLMITRLVDYVFEATVMTGLAVGQSVCIPRIVLNASNPEWPFVFQRRQFPVRVCYAVTINRSQGQTLKVGLYLQSPVFTHGQLYVAVSRVTSPEGLKILMAEEDGSCGSQTRNIVYKEVLDAVRRH
jgi:hypothetical protein